MKTFCVYCGTVHAMLTWPKKCSNPLCGREMFANPKPVGIVITQVQEGILLVKRAIPPQIGGLAFPGGFINSGETAEEAAARELQEETGLIVNPNNLKLFAQHSAPQADCILLFFQAPKFDVSVKDLKLTPEVSGFVTTTTPQELAFPLHTQVLAKFLKNS